MTEEGKVIMKMTTKLAKVTSEFFNKICELEKEDRELFKKQNELNTIMLKKIIELESTIKTLVK